MSIFVIILAGGNGNRFNNNQSELPKQYFKINNKTILRITTDSFLNNKKIDKIIIVIRPQDKHIASKIFEKELENKKIFLVHGGRERINSTSNGIMFINETFPNQCKYIMIHDAARPIVDSKIIEDSIEKIRNEWCDGVFPGRVVNEALKKINTINHQKTIASLNRNNYILAQTPQTFKFDKIFDSISKLNEENCIDIHDEIMLMEKNGYNISMIEGCKKNIKITDKNDFDIVRFYINNNEDL